MVTEHVTESEHVLERAVVRGDLTENGKAYVIAALDPFHDLQIQHLRGIPDYETQPSIIRTVKQSFQVASSGAGNSIMIYHWPILNEVLTHRTARRNAIIDLVTPDAGTDYTLGSVVATHYTDTANMTLTSGTPAFVSSLEPEYLQDSSRLIGMGIEVYDVTAAIQRQGTLTAFQIPQSTSEPSVYIVKSVSDPDIVTLPTGVQGLPLKKYPTSLKQIMELNGTVQWKAESGAYVVIPFHGRDNFAGQPTYETPLLYVDSTNAKEAVDFLNTAPLNIGHWAEPQVNNDFVVFLANKFTPTHSKGILLSGLGENSTFTVNVTYFLESFPAPDDISLVTLARPSAALDEVALEMVSTAMGKLPIAVQVCENGLGDWFAEVVAEVAPWIGAVSTGFGFAPGTLAATAAESAASTYMKSSSYTPTGGFFDNSKPKPKKQLAKLKGQPPKTLPKQKQKQKVNAAKNKIANIEKEKRRLSEVEKKKQREIAQVSARLRKGY